MLRLPVHCAAGALTLFITSLALSVHALAESSPSADAWFKTSYGPLWAETPYDDVEAILDHYSPDIVTHSSDGTISSTPRRAWLMTPMDAWKAEGWIRAELTDAQTTVINATTASVMTTWKDYYAENNTEVSCGWYLVDKVDGQWQISTYADTPCP